MIDQYPSSNGVLTSLIWRKTMSGGETSLSGYDNASQALSYTPGQEQVYLNGILLVRGDDYTATNGTSITGLSALAASDFIQVNCYNNFSVASVPAASLTGTVTNAQLAGSIANDKLANSAITINGSAISLGGSVTLAGDIESVTAGTGLTGGGNSGAVTLGLSTPVATTNGGTGLSTFTTGDLVYASGTDTLAKRSIGTTGQVLSVSGGVPTWATPSSGGGMTLLSTTTTNTGSAYTISSISQDYINLLLIWQGLSCTAGSFIRLDFAGGNASIAGVNQDGATITANAASAKLIPDTQGAGNAITCLITNYTAAAEKNLQIAFGGVNTGWRGGGYQGFHSYTSAITTFTVTLSAGTFSAGTLKVYGVK